MASYDFQVSASLLGAFSQDLFRTRRLWCREAIYATLENATLVPRNFLNRMSKHSNMINAKATDRCHLRLWDHVGTVILTTDPTFDHRGVHALAQVGMECHQCQVPEILWFRPRPGGILTR